MNVSAGLKKIFVMAAVFGGCVVLASAQKVQTPRLTTPGNGPYGVPQATFFVHRLGTDHAEGITTMDMNGDGDGRLDILSRAE